MCLLKIMLPEERSNTELAKTTNTWPPEENNKLVIIKPMFHARHFHIYHPSCYVISVPYESILHPSLPGAPDICPWMGYNLSPLPSGFCWAQWIRNRSKGGVKRQLIYSPGFLPYGHQELEVSTNSSFQILSGSLILPAITDISSGTCNSSFTLILQA